MSNPFIRAVAAASHWLINTAWPANMAAEFAAAALAEFEADRDCLEPGELTEWSAGAAVTPPASPLAAAPADTTDFSDLPVMQVKAVDISDDDIEWWSDFAYLEALADDIFVRAYSDGIHPTPMPAPRETPDFFKDIA